MAKVAFIGLGVMGFPMAGHLAVRGGHDVTVYNRTASKAAAWVEKFPGGRSAATPAEAAAGAEFVFSCVGNDDDLRAVSIGADGAFHTMVPDAVFIDHTTASAEVARELDARARDQGLHFIDAPVSGGQAGAENGQLAVMCGGEADAFERARPLMETYAKLAKLIGPAGSGQLTKMVNQIAIAGLCAGSLGGDSICRARGARRGERHWRDLQGRGAIVADGAPVEDHARAPVRFRICG